MLRFHSGKLHIVLSMMRGPFPAAAPERGVSGDLTTGNLAFRLLLSVNYDSPGIFGCQAVRAKKSDFFPKKGRIGPPEKNGRFDPACG